MSNLLHIRFANIMYKGEFYMRKKGLIDIYILEILESHSSIKKKISQDEIIHYLDIDYHLSVTRKTISGYLNELREDGYISGKRGIYKINKFDDHELRLLIDGVLFGQHVPEKNADELIQKLKKISFYSLKNRVKHVCYLQGINHTQNDNLYEIIDLIDEAIEKNRKIEITQCIYDIDGELHDCGTTVVDPYYLVTEKSKYYLICYAGRNNDIENRRVDRISKIKILEDIRIPIEKLEKYSQGFNLANYMKEHIYMFSGNSQAVFIKLKRKKIGDFIDWFGKDYRLVEQEGDFITVRIIVNENAVYYWALQYGEVAEVLKPVELRNRIRDGLMNMVEKYN